MGMPVLGYDVKIVDEAGGDAPSGTTGELVVRGVPGVSLMKGYFKDPAETADALRNGWLYSGEAYVDDEGWFFFVDRRRRQQ